MKTSEREPASSPAVAALHRGCIALVFVSIGLIALPGIFAILTEEFDEVHGRMMGSGAILLIGSLIGLANVAVVAKSRWPAVGIAGFILAVLTTACWLVGAWGDPEYEYQELFIRVSVTALFIALNVTILGQFTLLQTRFTLLRIALVAVGCLATVTFLLGIAMLWEVVDVEDRYSYGPSSTFLFLLVPLIAVTGVGMLVVPVVIRLVEQRTVHHAESIPMNVSLQMTCPACAFEQRFRIGPVWCKSCRAGFIVHVEEPRCECGYLLYQLRGEICPECGRDVPADLRWLTQDREDAAAGQDAVR